MSHVVKVELNITDLSVLEAAASAMGMELVKSTNFRWYGRHVGDYPLPEGFVKEDMGKCEYALRIINNSNAYQVGIARRRDGKSGYVALFDFWAGGHGLQEVIGDGGSKLKREYSLQTATKEMQRKGFRVTRTVNQKTGKPQMVAMKG